MKIYLDSDFKCHTTPAKGDQQVETDYFDGKCARYIEGYRFVPDGQSWTRQDGTVFIGSMAAPWEDYNTLLKYQAVYDDLSAELAESYREGVNSI